MNLETINKWLDEEYGCSYTKLEELHNFYFEKYCDLKKENKILQENAENNDKVVDKVNWENTLLKKKNKQLKERIEYLERSNNRRENTILEQRQEISDLEDNWNKLKEYLINDINNRNGNGVVEYKKGAKIEKISPICTLMEDKSKTMKEILDKMQEIEGSDNDE